jgi:hypothetical protein
MADSWYKAQFYKSWALRHVLFVIGSAACVMLLVGVPKEEVGMAKKLPSVDSQIRDAKAPKGSNLEALIRENQDFDMLAPGELDDNYRLPLWLRVLWRKQHPEIKMPEKNPGAAYPEVLSQIYKRMIANPDAPWGKKLEEGAPK